MPLTVGVPSSMGRVSVQSAGPARARVPGVAGVRGVLRGRGVSLPREVGAEGGRGRWRGRRAAVECREGGSGFGVGLVLGGIIGTAVGFLYAPQIGRAIQGSYEDEEELYRRPQAAGAVGDNLGQSSSNGGAVVGGESAESFEETRRSLARKINQLSDAIDDVAGTLVMPEAENVSPEDSTDEKGV